MVTKLEAIGKLKFFIAQLVSYILDSLESAKAFPIELLVESDRLLKNMELHNVHVYFLKLIHRRMGVGYAQQVLFK